MRFSEVPVLTLIIHYTSWRYFKECRWLVWIWVGLHFESFMPIYSASTQEEKKTPESSTNLSTMKLGEF